MFRPLAWYEEFAVPSLLWMTPLSMLVSVAATFEEIGCEVVTVGFQS
jgi:hypothetical protein